jgi:predicted DNA-binding protein
MTARGGASSRVPSRRIQVHTRLPTDLSERLRTFASGKGSSQNSILQKALKRYLDDNLDGPLILRRLDRLSRAVTRVHRDVTVVADALAIFVQIYLAHTPRLLESDKPSAEKAALERFAQFTEHVSAKVASGRSVIKTLVREAATEPDDELDAPADRARGRT